VLGRGGLAQVDVAFPSPSPPPPRPGRAAPSCPRAAPRSRSRSRLAPHARRGRARSAPLAEAFEPRHHEFELTMQPVIVGTSPSASCSAVNPRAARSVSRAETRRSAALPVSLSLLAELRQLVALLAPATKLTRRAGAGCRRTPTLWTLWTASALNAQWRRPRLAHRGQQAPRMRTDRRGYGGSGGRAQLRMLRGVAHHFIQIPP
jgi:hypothetical protein